MKIKYILDTSALVENPNVYKTFKESDIIIPVIVLAELDKLKSGQGESARNARVSIRQLDELSEKGDLSKGIPLDDNITLSVDAKHLDLTELRFSGLGDPTYGDTQILACAYKYWLDDPYHGVVLVSNDFNLRIKARARGIDAIGVEDSKKTKASTELYTGNQVIVSADAGLELQKTGYLDLNDWNFDLYENEYAVFSDDKLEDGGNVISLGRRIGDKLKMVKKQHPWGLSPKNREQMLAIDLLMDKSVELVTLAGPAGTGKSLITLAVCLEMVLNKHEYDKLVIYRPTETIDGGIGYLPGTIEEKMAPWFDAIYDSFEVLLAGKNTRKDQWRREMELFIKKGQIEMSCMSYIRGKSLKNSLIWCDEIQNSSIETAKTIITRAGEGSKVIFTGDLEQIDTAGSDSVTNALFHTFSNFKEYDLSGHMFLSKGERSRLATLAAKVL